MSWLGIQHFSLFLTAGILLNLTPGPDTAFILGRTIARGRRAGVASAFGIGVGSMLHTLTAALGLSAFLATSAWAFAAMKLLGACYLIFLGLRMIGRREATLPITSQSHRSAFRQGILTNLLNPKVALFYLAFLPQFIDPAANTKLPAFLVLGFTFVATGTAWCLVLAWLAGAIRRQLRENERLSVWINRTVGALFVALGLRLATTR